MFNEFDYQLDGFMLHCETKTLSKRTLSSYEATLRLFIVYLQREHNIESPDDVQPLHVRTYIRYLRERGKYTVVINDASRASNNPAGRTDHNKPLSDTTLANYLRNIKVFFNYLHAERIISVNPTKQIATIKPKRREKRLLTKDELRKLMGTFDLTTFHGFRNWVITRLILDTGVRIGECLDLRPEQLDFRARSILVKNTKNGHDRYVFFSPKLAGEMRRWLQYRDRFSDSEYLFPTTRGNRINVSSFETVIKKAGQSVGIEVTPHLLRNNFAKYYLLNGGDFVTLSRILGHSNVEVTQRAYLDFTNDEIMRKYQKHSPLNHLGI